MNRNQRAVTAGLILTAWAGILVMSGPSLIFGSFVWLAFLLTGVVNDLSTGPAWVDWVMNYSAHAILFAISLAVALWWVLQAPSE